MKKLFQDTELQARFERNGYVVLPLIGPDAVADIRSTFNELHPENPSPGFYSSTFSEDTAFKEKIFAKVDSWYAEKVDGVFQDYKKLGASFLLKQPGEKGRMPIHQDWTVTFEEAGDYSVTLWVPLQDVNAENGAIKVLPGSHRYSNALRGPSLPVIWREVYPILEEKMQTLEMKAGEAFIFDHSLLHSSHDNLTDQPRLAVTYGLAPQDAPMIYHWKEGEQIERIFMGDQLFMQYHNIGERPSFGVSQGFFRQDLSPVSAAECKALLAAWEGTNSGEGPDRAAAPEGSAFEKGDQNAKQIYRPLERIPGPHLKPVLQNPVFPICTADDRNQQLARNGYVILPFLSEEEIAELKAFYFAEHSATPEHFYASAHVSDLDFRQRMHLRIQEVFAAPLAREFPGANALGGSFIAKPKGQRGILPPHADWNITDEREYRSYNLWVPLVDTTVENGAVYILPGSHQWFDSFRGPGIPNTFQPVIQEVWDYMQPLEMKAGEALLYDHRLVHASPVNQTDELRLACVYGIIPQGAEMRYYTIDEGLLKSYRTDVAFFLKGEPEEGPGNLELLAVEPYAFPEVDLGALKAYLGIEEAEGRSGAQAGSPTRAEAGAEAQAGSPTRAEAQAGSDGKLTSPTGGKVGEAAAESSQARGFWDTYTPANIARELSHRIKGIFGSK